MALPRVRRTRGARGACQSEERRQGEVTNATRPRLGLPEELLPRVAAPASELSRDTGDRAQSRARHDWTRVLARGARAA